ncbi:hypothetical protein HFN89_04325 [Rhizobium laguerreae]|nr:hypothetical protein [Rhizobium laguerreae]
MEAQIGVIISFFLTCSFVTHFLVRGLKYRSVNLDQSRIEAIFNRDGVIASDLNSIIFLDADADRARIGVAFSNRS